MSEREMVFQRAEESFPSSKHINQDVVEEFRKLRADLDDRTRGGISLEQVRPGLRNDVPKLLHAKFRLLLDTLLNFLMKDARGILEPASTDLKNRFYEEDFRAKVSNLFEYKPESFDLTYRDIAPYLSHGRWVFPSIGALPTVLPAIKLWPSFLTPGGPLVKGVILLAGIAAGYACHVQLPKEQDKSWESLRKELLSYLDAAQENTLERLEDIRLGFVDDFMKFCEENGFQF